MKILFLSLGILFLTAVLASPSKAQNFSGIWKNESSDLSFTLKIKQKGKIVSGTYSYVVLPDAKRIRQGKFTGKIVGEAAEITFQNDFYEAEKGTAKLELITEVLIWTTTGETAELLLIPESFDLARETEK